MFALVCFFLPCGWISAADMSPTFPPELKKSALQATIRIYCKKPTNSGSGVIVGIKDGLCYALTAHHVVAKSRLFEVSAQTGEDFARFTSVTVLASSAESDLALIRFDPGPSSLSMLSISGKTAALKNRPLAVLNCGWQLDEGPTCAEDQALARVLLRHKDGTTAFFWETANTSEDGRSGGALIDQRGKVIGICSGNQNGKGYFSHRDEIDYFVRRHSSCSWLLDSSPNAVKVQ